MKEISVLREKIGETQQNEQKLEGQQEETNARIQEVLIKKYMVAESLNIHNYRVSTTSETSRNPGNPGNLLEFKNLLEILEIYWNFVRLLEK